MCGITGYWNIRALKREAFPSELGRSTASLDHRGPDDSGLWTSEDKQIGLGHARLSILDLSSHGHQPMQTEDGRFVLVYNGEIYNFAEIRSDLEKQGHKFQGTGDTEVLLAAYEQWNKACVERFIGMFSFAILDRKQKCLLLCRDRVGVKPLYYGWNGKAFMFGSELKALRAYQQWTPEIDRQALGEYLQYGYIAAPRSIYKNVHKLMPGHWLEISQDRPEPIATPYWSLQSVIEQGHLEDSEEDLTDKLEELLISAFQYRMVSDVPVGVFLSGGIDSSIVAAILQKHTSQPIHTFTIGFEDKSHDESVWAKKIAEHLGTQHTEYILDLKRAKDIIPDLPTIYDEPFGDSSGIPTTMVSELAHREVTVALSADGGDELFAGYSRYALISNRFDSIRSKPKLLRKALGKALGALPDPILERACMAVGISGITSPGNAFRKLTKLHAVLPEGSANSIFSSSVAHFMPHEINKLLGTYTDPRQGVGSYSGSFVEQMTQWDLAHYLPENILTKVDRATMSVGLEGREPLLDHRIIEFAFRLPQKFRMGQLGQKHLLRKVLYRYIPSKLIERPKQGFAIPVRSWLQQQKDGPMKMLAESKTLSDIGLDAILIRKEVNRLRNSGINDSRVWLLYMLHLWAERWHND